MIMETFLELIREILKGIVRELTAYFFRENVLGNKKTTPLRRKKKGGSPKILTVVWRSVSALLFFIIFLLYTK
ncbi:hypothetical protein IEC97_21055 [Neobacillus cucumis]|uniref:hypothetical protein n=1 Tax=Neobacillus cucumis TaxID=1740721 RepID=UPI0018DFC2FE|nr:hypothetical protein [Neobacillus cucumis]MBI0579852.1 hypothetical protein [Neobacillus cucumis]